MKWNDLGRRTLEELLTVVKENDVKFKEFIMED